MLDVVKELVSSHEHSRELLTIFQKLVARNSELELQLQEMLSRRHKGEGVWVQIPFCTKQPGVIVEVSHHVFEQGRAVPRA